MHETVTLIYNLFRWPECFQFTIWWTNKLCAIISSIHMNSAWSYTKINNYLQKDSLTLWISNTLEKPNILHSSSLGTNITQMEKLIKQASDHCNPFRELAGRKRCLNIHLLSANFSLTNLKQEDPKERDYTDVHSINTDWENSIINRKGSEQRD